MGKFDIDKAEDVGRRAEALADCLEEQKLRAQKMLDAGHLRRQEGDQWIAHTKKGVKAIEKGWTRQWADLVQSGDIELLQDGHYYAIDDVGRVFIEGCKAERESHGFGWRNPGLIAQLQMYSQMCRMANT